MRDALLGFIIGIMLVWNIWGVPVEIKGDHHGAIADAAVSTPDPFSQRNFPCQEDEALLYWPTFGPDKVGCMNVEQILP